MFRERISELRGIVDHFTHLFIIMTTTIGATRLITENQ